MSQDYGRRDLSSVMPNNLNEEAVVFRGLTSTEIVIVTVISTLFWTVITFIVGAAIGKTTTVIGFTFVLVLITVFVLGTIMQKIKRGRPPGHYQHLIALFFGRHKIKRTTHVIFDGSFSMGRSKQVILVSQHLNIDPESLETDENYE